MSLRPSQTLSVMITDGNLINKKKKHAGGFKRVEKASDPYLPVGSVRDIRQPVTSPL